MASRKLSKHIVIVLSVMMIGGLIGVFILQYGTKGGKPGGVSAQKTAETVAAQVGNDTPESVSMAKAEIAEADQHIKQDIARQQEQARKFTPVYPQDKLPFETGEITPEQLSRYQSAKEALGRAFDSVRDSMTPQSVLPSSFDEGGAVVSPEKSDESQQHSGQTSLSGNTVSGKGSGGTLTLPEMKNLQQHADRVSGIAASNQTVPGNAMPATDHSDSADESTGDARINDPAHALVNGLAVNTTSQLVPEAAKSTDAMGNQLIQTMLSRQTPQIQRDPNEVWQEKQEKTAKSAPDKPIAIGNPPQNHLLQEGAVIPLVLLTALNNALPGHVSARVTSNVYDSITGDVLIIPAGSKLEGNYNSSTLFGQNRMMFGFKRIILPSGASLKIDAWNGGDAQGRAGVAGDLNNHLWQQFGTGILLATLGWALQPPNSPNGVIVNTAGGNYSLSSAAGQVTSDTAGGILAHYQNMKPELNVAAGTKLSLIVLQDIVLAALSTAGGR
ncbi:MAG: TrbI/VirB10 family protein [Betaproteobacteria bacterium]|nr:TrbI/VirB10 family protein [Betaproteobacteria bacterium]